MRHLALVLLVSLVGCVDDEHDDDELDEEGEHTAYEISTHIPDNSPGGSGGPEPDPTSGGPWKRPTMLKRCSAACDGGQESVEAFCRVLRDIRLRAACWAIAKGSAVACKGWCYWHWGR